MICMHCGYCCIELDVIIVSPYYINTIDEIGFDNIRENHLTHKKTGEPCPHLILVGDKFLCSIYNKLWYKQTPCYSHKQIEETNSKCRIGKFILENNKQQRFINLFNQKKE